MNTSSRCVGLPKVLRAGPKGGAIVPDRAYLLVGPVITTGGPGTMFLTFETNEQREEFLRQVGAERADLLAKLHSAAYQPTIVCRDLSDEETDWLKQRMEQRGKVHADVKFSPMR